MHCKSIEINRFLNLYLSQHLKGNALAYITKLFLNAPCEAKKGHSLDEPYSLPLKYTAKILGRSRETIRRLQEELHALGIITVDQQTWESYHNDKNQRKKTGMVQDVRFSERFKNIVKRFLSKEENIEWTFTKPDSFIEKCKKNFAKAKEAKDRFIEKILKEDKDVVKTIPPKLIEDFQALFKVAHTATKMETVIKCITRSLIKGGYAQDQEEAMSMVPSIQASG